jgi:hypothetical protein
MTVFSFIQRLTRDLVQDNPANLTAEERQQVVDCVNGSLQRLHDLAPDHSKVTAVSLYLGGPKEVTLNVTEGSHSFTGYVATDVDLYCTIRIDGDGVDNQIVGFGDLLMPYAGDTGTVNATIYYDAIALPGEYSSIDDNPRYADTNEILQQGHFPSKNRLLQRFALGQPECWTVEPNAQQNDFRAVFRVDRLPTAPVRLKATARIAPPRISFLDSLASTAILPIRPEHIESYLLPMVRGTLAETSLWRDKETRVLASKRGEEAEMRYEAMIPKQLMTPRNTVGTPMGY